VALSGTVTDKGHVDDTGKGANFALDVEAGDNYFAPTFVKASPGATVKVTVKNTGASPHTFTIDGTAVNIVLNTPGQSGTAMVTLPASGSLTLSCTYHKALGLQGPFYVRYLTGEGPASSSERMSRLPRRGPWTPARLNSP